MQFHRLVLAAAVLLLSTQAGVGLAASSATDAFESLGTALQDSKLASERGGDVHVSNQSLLNGALSDNVAVNDVTGGNSISQGAFSGSSGMPMVIQNSGNNVIIQNSTILNLNMK
jgi:hypothetical protein